MAAKTLSVGAPGRSYFSRVLVGFSSALNDVITIAQAAYALFTVPANFVVLRVRTRIITAFTASVTLVIGDGDDTDRFSDSTHIAPTSAVTTGNYISGNLATAVAGEGGRLYAAADTVDVVVGGATPVAGQMDCIIEYMCLGEVIDGLL